MRILLMRHCEAVAGADNDPDRPLTSGALVQLRSRAEAGQVLLGAVERVVSSPWRRAAETASALHPFLPRLAVTESSEALLPRADVTRALELLERFAQEDGTLLLIGHQPLLGRLIALLCDGPMGEMYHPGPGSIAVIDLDWPAAGLGSLRYWYQL